MPIIVKLQDVFHETLEHVPSILKNGIHVDISKFMKNPMEQMDAMPHFFTQNSSKI
jgi:hypothetical protein